jgi:hypothetical protein
LEIIIQGLQEGDGQDHEWKDKLELREAPDGPVVRISKALNLVKRKIEPGTGFRRTISALRWPFDARDVEKIVAAVEREKTLLKLAFSHNCLYI